jgi:hypothetical protein
VLCHVPRLAAHQRAVVGFESRNAQQMAIIIARTQRMGGIQNIIHKSDTAMVWPHDYVKLKAKGLPIQNRNFTAFIVGKP